ncbi:hypothetical protein CRENPOLYSF1_390020 [Crenothrix polyspora]|uniref:Uncharacterized protein n=1 Tax=Crenothrix polyspora TaxID=360316 RepID=A0A1R4HA82_9GAMM|nr:hypothetical protein CRENPOLYSF1_390020 [Crenothrix polyspora]
MVDMFVVINVNPLEKLNIVYMFNEGR